MRSRDDQEALETRRAELRQRLAEATRSADELQAATQRSEALEAEIADLDARLAHRKSRRLPLLDRIRIASPCDASWDAMTGDDRVRFCGLCEKNVYNLSAMTRADAEALLAEREGSICVRLYQRADGTVITTDCPEGVRRRRRRTAFAVAGAGAMAATAAFAASALRAQQPQPAAPLAVVATTPEPVVAMGAPPSTTAPDEPHPRYVMGAPPIKNRPVMGKPALPRPPRDPGKVTVPKRTPRPTDL